MPGFALVLFLFKKFKCFRTESNSCIWARVSDGGFSLDSLPVTGLKLEAVKALNRGDW